MKKTFPILLLCLFSFSALAAEDNNSMPIDNTIPQNIYSINIDGVITGSTAEFVASSIAKAAENNGLLLIKLNTPGGVLDATRNIIQSILSSPVPVAVYVTPSGARAASAGIFITLAANYAVMDKGTNIGAAHPINSDGKDIEGELGKKVINDTVAFIRSIAETRGRDVNAAVKMVTESESFTAEEALKLNIIDAVADKNDNIKNMLATRFSMPPEFKVENIDKTFSQKIFDILANPNILAGLLFLGMMLIGLEFKMPGTFIFAGLGALFLVLFGIGSNIIPVNYLAVLLILGGLGLFIADMFVASLGLLSIGGIAALFFGMRMLFDHGDNMGIDISLWLIIGILAMVAGVAFIIGKLIVGDFKRKPMNGMDTLIGKKVKIIEWNHGEGKIAVYGEIWNAAGSPELKTGEEVFVESYEDMTLEVKKEK